MMRRLPEEHRRLARLLVRLDWARRLASMVADEQWNRSPGTAAACERLMRELTNGERGCANPEEHRR